MHCIFQIMPFNKNEIFKKKERKRARQTAGERERERERETETETETEREFLKKGHGTDRQTLRGV